MDRFHLLKTRFPALCICSLLCAACEAFGPKHVECMLHDGEEWIEAQSDHFTLQTNVDSEAARETLQNLEWTRRALLRIWNESFDPPTRIDVILINRPWQWEEFGELWIAGKLIAVAPRPMMVLVGKLVPGDFIPQQDTVAHELTHYLSRYIFVRTPLWFEEGFAQFTQTVHKGDSDRTVVFGQPDLEILRYVQQYRPLPLNELWNWGTKPLTDEERNRYYASSFAWFHYLYNRQGERFGRFWDALAEGREPLAAWQQVFSNVDETQLYQDLIQYLDGGQYSEFRFPLTAKSVQITEKNISPAEIHLMRARLFRFGATQTSSEQVKNELETAVSLDENQVEARAALIQMDTNPKRQQQSSEQLAAEFPTEPASLKTLLFVLRKQGTGDRIESVLVRALQQAPEDPALLGELALLRLGKGEMREANDLMARALDQAPWSPWVLAACALTAAQSGACDQTVLFELQATTALSQSGYDPDGIAEIQKLLDRAAAECRTDVSETIKEN